MALSQVRAALCLCDVVLALENEDSIAAASIPIHLLRTHAFFVQVKMQ